MMNNPPPATARPYQGRPHRARKSRVKVDLWCEILGPKDRAVGHIRNLNVGGCRILSPSAFPVKETLSLVLADSADGPDLRLKVQLRWLALNPNEGPFELGCQFLHAGGSEGRIERMLRGVIQKTSTSETQIKPIFGRFGGGLETVRTPGAPTPGDLRKVYATEGLDRLLKPDPSSPLP